MIVITYPGTIHFKIRGQPVEEMLTQELVDLARKLAIDPELLERVDIETMTLKKEVEHGSSRKRKAHA